MIERLSARFILWCYRKRWRLPLVWGFFAPYVVFFGMVRRAVIAKPNPTVVTYALEWLVTLGLVFTGVYVALVLYTWLFWNTPDVAEIRHRMATRYQEKYQV